MITLAIITLVLWYIEGVIPLTEVLLFAILLALCICCDFPAYDPSKVDDSIPIENE